MSLLFSPIEVKAVAFRNRVVMPPMVTLFADEDGCVTDRHTEHYVARARAGTALIILEATAVDARGRVWTGGLGAYDDGQTDGLAGLASAIRNEGAIAGIQLVHGGPQGDLDISGNDRVGPSEVGPPSGGPLPRALSVEEISAIQERFAEAAGRAADAGFDLVEVHGAHDYLLDSFLSTQTNKRSDEYGGGFVGRMRFMVETCHAVRQQIGDRALLCCRISLFNKAEGEIALADFHGLVRGLEEADIDVLHVSTDGALKPCFGEQQAVGQAAKKATSLPTIVAGGLGDPADAERALSDGHADFAAIGSAMMENPNWTAIARAALGAQ